MKNLLFFFILFSLALPTQASASAYLYPHLAYQKQKVGKPKMKPKGDGYEAIVWGLIGAYYVLTGLVYLLGLLIFTWSVWVLLFFWAIPLFLFLLNEIYDIAVAWKHRKIAWLHKTPQNKR